MQRIITTVLTDDLVATRNCLVNLLDLKVSFDSDWFVSLIGRDSTLSIGAIRRSSEFIPDEFRKSAAGVIITVVVDNVDTNHQMAIKHGLRVVEAPRDMPYGQRRMLVEDPSGVLIDVSSPIAIRG